VKIEGRRRRKVRSRRHGGRAYSLEVDLVAVYEWDDVMVQGMINKINLGKTNDNTGEEGKLGREGEGEGEDTDNN
jgi:hypothetical protein